MTPGRDRSALGPAYTYPPTLFRDNILFIMKSDVLVIRVGFVLLLAAVAFLINPLRSTAHLPAFLGDDVMTRKILSGLVGAVVAVIIVAFEMRARTASLKTLIGAAIGSILGIVGAYLIGMLISAQDINTVPGEMK